MALKVVPTKGNLIAMKKSLQLENLGYNLMDQKRNVLIKEMTTLLDDVKLIRDQITSSYQEAYDALQEANISMGLITDIVNSTPEDYGISIAYRSVMGVEIPKIAYDKQPLKMTYDIERSNSKVDYAYNCFYNVKQLTVLLAEVENSVYRLANTIRKTQKRANALRNISIPRFESTIKVISEALEEKEREEFTRQKVIKEMKK
ncbi:V-type ATP synthase subunit D [Thomasclavelia ramosa]|uniref:V-type ATP synthase subunit D n=1 Tax=Thomasclavelia ramosa TaxID=1547 RepID=A0A3E3ED64_9FIRM|nr:V-type ATP synthase subunit D [Thomasclavelia ramosa]RGD84706.1 V-type ATP synthase subunit D [Thomasclavelia ramosa]